MYNELYAAWRQEKQETHLGGLSPDFYTRMAEYLKRINEENRTFDKKSVRLNLLEHEAKNVQRMLEELLWARYRKLVRTITQNHKVPSELLTTQEAKICENFLVFTDAYQKFAKTLLVGGSLPVEHTKTIENVVQPAPVQAAQRKATLRFVKSIPAIMGADMKPYGPFKVEDVASLPAENAKILIKQGLAVAVEVS